tara:strand:- start:528 stop:836 length:309 start_codon:yes stop_codon:yes gene_type:complete
MILNSASVIEEFTKKNSGICLYLSNSFCQDTSENGKKIPEIGCHSVIDSPDSVSRVMPPIIIRKISVIIVHNNHKETSIFLIFWFIFLFPLIIIVFLVLFDK